MVTFPDRTDGQVIDSTWFNLLQDSVTAVTETNFYASNFASIQAALDAANSVGGGTVKLAPGIHNVQLTMYSDITLDLNEATLRAPDGSNGAVIKGENFDILTGTNTLGGIFGWSIRNGWIDCNSANNPINSWGIQVYGADYRLSNVYVRDWTTRAIHSEFWDGGSPTGSASAFWHQVKCKTGNGTGIDFLGPHDSVLHQTMVASCSESGIHIRENAHGVHVTDSHFWGNTMDYAVRATADGVELVSTQAESAQTAQVLVEGDKFHMEGGRIYWTGSVANPVGIEIAAGANSSGLYTEIQNCTSGAVKWADGASGNHRHRCMVIMGSGIVIAGTPPPGADYEYKTSGGVAAPTSVHSMPAEFPYIVTRPDTGVFVSDDFLSGFGSNGQMGELGWSVAGGGGQNFPNGETNHPGILRRTTGASAGTYAVLRLVASTDGVFSPATDFETLFILRPNDIDSDTTVRVGLAHDATDNPPVDGIYLERLGADTNWFVVTRIAGVQTRTDSGVAVAANWLRLRIRRVDASTIGFSIGGGAEIQHTTNIPTETLSPFFGISNGAAASNKTMDLDAFSLSISGLSR